MPTGVEEAVAFAVGVLKVVGTAVAEAGAVLGQFGDNSDDARFLAERNLDTIRDPQPEPHVLEGSDDEFPCTCPVDGAAEEEVAESSATTGDRPRPSAPQEAKRGPKVTGFELIELGDDAEADFQITLTAEDPDPPAGEVGAGAPGAVEQELLPTDDPAEASPDAPEERSYIEYPTLDDFLRWGTRPHPGLPPLPTLKTRVIIEDLFDVRPPDDPVELPGDEPAGAASRPGILDELGGLAGVSKLSREGAELAHLLSLDEAGLSAEQRTERSRRIFVLSLEVGPEAVGLVLGARGKGKGSRKPERKRREQNGSGSQRGTATPDAPTAPAPAKNPRDRKVDPDVDASVEHGIVEESRSTSRPSKKTRLPKLKKTGLLERARKEFDRVRDGYARRLGVKRGGQVHHAVELQVLERYPGAFTKKELNAFGNMRGIGTENKGRRQLHNSKIRESWDRHYSALDKEVARRGLQPGTKAYRDTVRRYLKDGAKEIDYVMGQFFTEYRSGLDWTKSP